MAKFWCWLFGHNWQEGHMPSYRFFCSRCGGLGNITYAQQSVQPTVATGSAQEVKSDVRNSG